MEPELVVLLHIYANIFAQLMGLPLQRDHDHNIQLVQGVAPVKVHPYRYPHSQKTQIEIMV